MKEKQEAPAEILLGTPRSMQSKERGIRACGPRRETIPGSKKEVRRGNIKGSESEEDYSPRKNEGEKEGNVWIQGVSGQMSVATDKGKEGDDGEDARSGGVDLRGSGIRRYLESFRKLAIASTSFRRPARMSATACRAWRWRRLRVFLVT